jgi:hypothetical protein
VGVVVFVDRGEESLEFGGVFLLLPKIDDVDRDLILLELLPQLD